MRTVLEEDKMQREVATVLTQVVVDPADPAYSNPTKPIGPFYTREQAERLRRDEGWTIVEDSGRGYRRVVCSPKPLHVLPLRTIKLLVQNETVVIAGGGGGIPVSYGMRSVVGTEGVIDKDATAALLAYNLGAELFVILTGVERVCLDYGKPSQRPIDLMSAAEARKWLEEGQFPARQHGAEDRGGDRIRRKRRQGSDHRPRGARCESDARASVHSHRRLKHRDARPSVTKESSPS